MKVAIDKSFQKDTQKITDKKLLQSLATCIELLQQVDTLTAIPQCKKLKGASHAYRIKMGDYRIGFVFEKQTIVLIRFLHRSKVYEYFPH